jgi:hypothetical protein
LEKRKRLGVMISVAIASAAMIYFWSIDRRFGESCFDRIKEGMSESEVEGILGSPPGDYRPSRYIRPNHFVSISKPMGFQVKESGLRSRELASLENRDLQDWIERGMPRRPPKVTRKEWLAKRWGIVVAFDEDGRVIHHELLEIVRPEPPGDFLGRLRWYLRF